MVMAGTIHLGLKGSYNRSAYYDPTDSHWKNIRGYGGGVYAAYAFNDSVAIRSEWNYLPRGSHYTTSNFDIIVNAQYLEWTLLGSLVPSDNTSLRVLIGPGFEFFNGGDYQTSTNITGKTVTVSDQIDKSRVNSPDISFILGVEYSRHHLIFDLRYTWGFITVYKDNQLLENNADVRNRALEMGIGFEL